MNPIVRSLARRCATVAVLVALLTVPIVSSGCAKTVTPETPRAAAALTADAIVIRVNELQAAVIQACGPAVTCAPNTLSTNLARDLVQTTIDLRTTLKAVPDGWQATVRTAWTQAQPRFAGITHPAIQAALAAVNALIGSL
jgi:hypothetical protein